MDSRKDAGPIGSTFNKGGNHSYHHGRVRQAVHEVAREILESGAIETVGLRDISRRIGVSASAMYRHFANKDELLASVAAQGFRELATALESAANEPDPVAALGLAYIEFALTKRGLFGLMFGRHLAQKQKYPVLQEAAQEAIRIAGRAGAVETGLQEPPAAGLAAWGFVHGLSCLCLANVLPESMARTLAREVLAEDGRARRSTSDACEPLVGAVAGK